VNSTDSPPNRGPARKLNIAVAMPPWFDVPPDAYGGIESLVAGLIDALIERGHEVVMVGAGTNRTRAEFRRTYQEAPSERIGQALPEIVHAAWANRYLDELDVDVIHDHSSPARWRHAAARCGPSLPRTARARARLARTTAP
jgi:Methylmalonyl-CoA mutase, C-terminal domain/subunit (cobalamin-binding)